MSEIMQKLVSSTLYYEDGHIETIEHDQENQPRPDKNCPLVVTGKTRRSYFDISKIENRAKFL